MDIYLEGQNVKQVEINKEVKQSYIEYAMSVIVSRALPDVRDGLKPVHRRILYSMYEDNLTHDKDYRKSATTVGNVLGHYHPHGDSSVYDAMVRLAQPFSMRYTLIDGQGNFGNIDGDGAAAYRYTEARMSKIASELLTDIEKNVVDFTPNFDNKLEEPTVLPSGFPNLLVNGSVGIAVGMATYIPPHNLSEVIDGTIFVMENPECEVLDIMEYIKGPDFPTSAMIYGTSGIKQAYLTGKGHVMVRAVYHVEEKANHKSLVYTEIPYSVNKSNLVKSIADLVKDKRVEGISEIRDESGRNGMRIVVELKRDANELVIANQLYKYTQLQDTCAMNMLALVDNEPKTLNLKQILVHYIRHREQVITRRVNFDLEKARAKAHIYEGYKIAIDNIDEVIKIIRKSRSSQDAKDNLIQAFDFSDVQAQAIVKMPLGNLASLEVDAILQELERLHALIADFEDILQNKSRIREIMKEEMLEIKKRFGDDRRTAIEEAEDDIVLEDLIEKHKCVITITHDGYIKRIPADAYTAQNRGGKGLAAMKTKEEDSVKDIFISHSHNYLFMFSNLGRLYIKKCYEIPEASRTAKGSHMNNVLPLSQGEFITAFVSVSKINTEETLVMVTEKGVIKRTPLNLFRHIRRGGVNAIRLDEDDKLLFVKKTEGNCQIIVATSDGLAIKFEEQKVRVMGRTARGVRAIRLTEGAKVVGMITATPNAEGEYDSLLLTATENGMGKCSRIETFRLSGRGGKGVRCQKITEKTGSLVGITEINGEDDIMLITNEGILIRIPADQISTTGRASAGVILMRLNEGQSIVGLQRVQAEETEEGNEVLDESEEVEDLPETEEADDTVEETDDTQENEE
ncbi:MAG: DNA gyrase subunit A [Ruminococcaceae bacterium]|nr:DNA gyrase subunit A [Oscillospiraceae bacterium]